MIDLCNTNLFEVIEKKRRKLITVCHKALKIMKTV